MQELGGFTCLGQVGAPDGVVCLVAQFRQHLRISGFAVECYT